MFHITLNLVLFLSKNYMNWNLESLGEDVWQQNCFCISSCKLVIVLSWAKSTNELGCRSVWWGTASTLPVTVTLDLGFGMFWCVVLSVKRLGYSRCRRCCWWWYLFNGLGDGFFVGKTTSMKLKKLQGQSNFNLMEPLNYGDDKNSLNAI